MTCLNVETSQLLFLVDQDLMNEARTKGCPHCGGVLYQADYSRKVRGVAPALAHAFFGTRFSLCCGTEGCRKRVTPRSVRFLGRALFPMWLAVLVGCVVENRDSPENIRWLEKAMGVNRRSIQRWRTQWKSLFSESALFWRRSKASLFAVMDIQKPSLRALLQVFGFGSTEVNPKALVHLLKFLSPLSTSLD